MAKKILKITVKPDGAINIDADGFRGKGCVEAIKKFEELGKTTKSQHKSEFYKPNNFNAVLRNDR